jgi:hypothetical protein
MNVPISPPRILVFITAPSFSFLELLNGAACLEYHGLNLVVNQSLYWGGKKIKI